MFRRRKRLNCVITDADLHHTYETFCVLSVLSISKLLTYCISDSFTFTEPQTPDPRKPQVFT